MNLRAHIASATLSSMAMSLATQKHARYVHFADTPQQIRKVDVDDSEAAPVLSNFVLHCGETMPPTKQSILVRTQHPHCRRSSRLLHLLGIEKDTPPSTSQTNKNNTIAIEVSVTLPMYDLDVGPCRIPNFLDL